MYYISSFRGKTGRHLPIASLEFEDNEMQQKESYVIEVQMETLYDKI